MNAEEVAHKLTDDELAKLERKIAKVYKQAGGETESKLAAYMEQFKRLDEQKLKQVADGVLSRADYEKWRVGKIAIGENWKAIQNNLAQDYVNADKIAAKIINGEMPNVYALNHNYASYAIENGVGMNLNFTLYDKATVERLLRENVDLLPHPKIDIAKDLLWNKQKIQSAVTQGILQGEPIDKIANRLRQVTDMNRNAAIRNARTTTTGAENAGRIDSYKEAESKGIKLKKEWLATLDTRTRDSHAALDGEKVDSDKKFSNGLMYPGDPSGAPAEVYNCRCTLVAAVDGVEDVEPVYRRDNISGELIKDMSYEDWEKAKSTTGPVTTINQFQQELAKCTSTAQVAYVINQQGWFEYGALFDDLSDLDSAKSIASSYEQIFDKYPDLKGKFQGVNSRELPDNVYAQCYLKSGKVEINTNLYNNFAELARSYDSDVISGWHCFGTTAESIVTHEVGHAIDGYLTNNVLDKLVDLSNPYAVKTVAGYLKPRVMKACGLTAGDTATAVSRYASTNAKEWFAEAFAEYTTSANPRPVAMELGKQIEKLLKMIGGTI